MLRAILAISICLPMLAHPGTCVCGTAPRVETVRKSACDCCAKKTPRHREPLKKQTRHDDGCPALLTVDHSKSPATFAAAWAPTSRDLVGTVLIASPVAALASPIASIHFASDPPRYLSVGAFLI